MAGVLNVDQINNSAGTGGPSYPNGQIGVTTNSNAAAGYIGEYITQSRLLASASSLSSGTTINVTATALSLTAGDWMIDGIVIYTPGAATTFTNGILDVAVSATSATFPATSTIGVENSSGEFWVEQSPPQGANANAPYISLVIPSYRFSASGSTTLYLVTRATFGTSTLSASGSIRAWRVR